MAREATRRSPFGDGGVARGGDERWSFRLLTALLTAFQLTLARDESRVRRQTIAADCLACGPSMCGVRIDLGALLIQALGGGAQPAALALPAAGLA
jgi:hypothetical protein